MTTAICPGSYDPVTYGHLDVIKRAASIFDRVVVGVVRDPHHKGTMFTVEERVRFLRDALNENGNVEVDVFAELVVEFARRWGATTMVKGLRAISDFEWEFQMNHLNRTLAPTSKRSTSWRARSSASSPRVASRRSPPSAETWRSSSPRRWPGDFRSCIPAGGREHRSTRRSDPT